MKRITKHAQVRIQQRGKRRDAVAMVLRYGSYQEVAGGRTYYMDSQAHQRAKESEESGSYRKISDQLKFFIIVSHDDEIVTVAHSRRPRLYHRRRPRPNRRLRD